MTEKDIRKKGTMETEGKPRYVEGEHDGGFLVGMTMHEVDGDFHPRLVGVVYDEECPTLEEWIVRAQKNTNCENVKLPRPIKISMHFEELRHNCQGLKSTLKEA